MDAIGHRHFYSLGEDREYQRTRLLPLIMCNSVCALSNDDPRLVSKCSSSKAGACKDCSELIVIRFQSMASRTTQNSCTKGCSDRSKSYRKRPPFYLFTYISVIGVLIFWGGAMSLKIHSCYPLCMTFATFYYVPRRQGEHGCCFTDTRTWSNRKRVIVISKEIWL